MRPNALFRSLLLAGIGLPDVAAASPSAAELFDLSLEELQDITIYVASKTPRTLLDAPGIVSVIGREEIQASGARTLADLLKRVPGVQVLNDFSGHRQVWIRGVINAENERVLLLIDGVPRREAASAHWSPDEEIDIQDIERIEITRGPGSALYGGNAYAGVISVHMRRGASPWAVQAGAGNRSTGQASVRGGHDFGAGSLRLAGSYYDTDGWRSERGRNGGPSDNATERRAQTLQARLDLDSGFAFDLTAGNLDYRYPLHPVLTRRDSYYTYYLAALKYARQVGDWNVSTRFSADDSRMGFDSLALNANGTPRQIKEQKKTSRVYGWEGQADWQQSATLRWIFGASADHNRAVRLEEEWNPGHRDPARRYFINSWLSQNGEGPGENSATTRSHAVFVQNEARSADGRYGLTTGLRWDRFDGFGDQLSPRLAFVYLPSEGRALKLLAGEAFRPPTIRQLYVRRSDGKQPGNPFLDPEVVRTYEAEWLQQFGEHWQLRADVFSNRFENTTVTIAEGPWQSSPIPRRIDGAELELKGSWELRDWRVSWFVNHTNLFTAHDETPHGDIDIPYLATRLGNAGVTAQRGDWQFYTALNWVGRRNDGLSYDPADGSITNTYHTDPGFAAFPEFRARDNKGGYVTQDVSVRWQRGALTSELIVHNLWDRLHFDPTYDPDIYYDVTRERRSVMLRLEWTF